MKYKYIQFTTLTQRKPMLIRLDDLKAIEPCTFNKDTDSQIEGTAVKVAGCNRILNSINLYDNFVAALEHASTSNNVIYTV